MKRLCQVSLRQWVMVGTVVVILVSVALIVEAYRGWTLGLRTHDRGVIVTVALTADALFAGLVAVVLALAAYWSASGVPKLEIEIEFPFLDQDHPGLISGRALGSDTREVQQSGQTHVQIVIKNTSVYAARNAGVRIRFEGLGRIGMNPAFADIEAVPRKGAIAFQWDGGADEIIHGKWERRLPTFSLERSLLFDGEEPSMEVTVVADGIQPVIRSHRLAVLTEQ